MSKDMIDLARRNAIKSGFTEKNVDFIHSSLTDPMPLDSSSVDCVISNCVLNLLPDDGKAFVLKEVFRVLKPGGRVAIHDIVAKQPLPDDIRKDLAAHIGCVAGAIEQNVYEGYFKDAGFKEVLMIDTHSDLTVYNFQVLNTSSCCALSPEVKDVSAPFPVPLDANEYVGAYSIYALKD